MCLGFSRCEAGFLCVPEKQGAAMTSFASNTSVSVSRSRVEIEDLLTKWKASRVAVATEPDRAHVLFTIERWSVKFTMPLPTTADAAKLRDSRYKWRDASDSQKQKWLEQTARTKWRALLLTIKAKLVSVENGVESFEEAFMAHLVLPGGETMGQRALPAMREQLPQLADGGANA